MARDDDIEEQAGDQHEPRECMACRGSGSVISNLGESPNKVSCPWCDGSGERLPASHDAQAHWGPQETGSPEPDPEAAA